MSANATTVRRWRRDSKPRIASMLPLSDAVRESSARVVGIAFPRGKTTELVDKYVVSRARKDGGPLRKTALMLMEADTEGRAQIMAFLQGVVRAYDRDGESVVEAMLAEHAADLEEDAHQPAVFADPSPANLRRWLPGARKAYAALGRAIAAAERKLMEVGG